MNRVAVSQRVDVIAARGETRDAMDQRLAQFVASCGQAVVPVPNRLGLGIHAWLFAVQPQAVLLSGGNDIGQCPERDATERVLLDHAQAQRLPVLGICRGMQMMAHWAGTALRPVEGHVRTRHVLTGLLGAEVNSYHDFGLAACPAGFEVLARSEDGEIEAMRHLSWPWEAWMWHPEREEHFAVHDVQRARTILGG